MGVVWGSQGAPRSSLGAAGLISGIFREIPGALLAPFWAHFSCFFGSFSGSVFSSILEAILRRFGCHFGRLLGAISDPKAVRKSVSFSVRFFLCGGSVTPNGGEVAPGKNSHGAPWSGALSFQKRDHTTPCDRIGLLLAFLALEAGLQARDLTRLGPLARRI